MNDYDEWVADEGWWCRDCSVHTGIIGEYYMVHKELWNAHFSGDGMLCITCLEARIGRELTSEDFTDCPLNTSPMWYRSDTLLERLGN